jgi:hypothetical protein
MEKLDALKWLLMGGSSCEMRGEKSLKYFLVVSICLSAGYGFV